MDDCLENGELIMSKYICKILFNVVNILYGIKSYVDRI